jgi:hypothetical protein
MENSFRFAEILLDKAPTVVYRRCMLNPNTIQFSIRISREAYKKLKREAEKERRTLNAEIVKRIEEGLARNGKKVTA